MNALARFSLHTRLTLRYILALGMVALLTLTSYALMDNAVRTEVLGARLLNVAGRQRMLCQRVEILVMRAADDAGDERKARLQELDAALRELEQGHRLLAHGSAQSLGLAADSPVIEILRGNEDGVEALYHDFIDQVGTWRAVLAQGWGMDAQAVLRFRSSGDALLARLDQHMTALQHLGERTLEKLRALVMVLLGAAFAGLLLTGLLLFRPMVAEVVRDREHLESLNRSLETQASTDKLTGAYNRRTWDVEIRREFSKARRQGSRLCMVMMDLDLFKGVNDEHGHQRGDEVLREFAERIRRAVRESDTLYRLGGEEFAVLLPGTDIEQGRQTAEKLRLGVAAAALSGLAITASFGVAETDGDESPDELYRRADQALYAAKENGRNRVESAATMYDKAGLLASRSLQG